MRLAPKGAFGAGVQISEFRAMAREPQTRAPHANHGAWVLPIQVEATTAAVVCVWGSRVGLPVHGRERPGSQMSVGARTAEFRDLGIYIPNCNKGPQCNGGSRSAVAVNVRSGSAAHQPRLRHLSALSGIKDCPEIKTLRVRGNI